VEEFCKSNMKIRGDVTWKEQFGYIYLCIKEVAKIAISNAINTLR